ncbi:hypothetical protein NPIL_458161 [Nephila pilipes]|uniref:Uncharacterized protein n=1 Tax=Nephila pilipes TaxID=299642 RepID=A0A8X6QGS7_NEPPI|nr:hypothetical protein NPIL_63951 [Nephila pilipes]GFU29165.1 hypothetical protein NPIL_458161 [Nephila pilipes]
MVQCLVEGQGLQRDVEDAVLGAHGYQGFTITMTRMILAFSITSPTAQHQVTFLTQFSSSFRASRNKSVGRYCEAFFSFLFWDGIYWGVLSTNTKEDGPVMKSCCDGCLPFKALIISEIQRSLN